MNTDFYEETSARLIALADPAPTDGGTTKFDWERVNLDDVKRFLQGVNIDRDCRVPFTLGTKEFQFVVLNDTTGISPAQTSGYNLYQLYYMTDESPRKPKILGTVYKSVLDGVMFWSTHSRSQGGEVHSVHEGILALFAHFNNQIGPTVDQIRNIVMSSEVEEEDTSQVEEGFDVTTVDDDFVEQNAIKVSTIEQSALDDNSCLLLHKELFKALKDNGIAAKPVCSAATVGTFLMKEPADLSGIMPKVLKSLDASNVKQMKGKLSWWFFVGDRSYNIDYTQDHFKVGLILQDITKNRTTSALQRIEDTFNGSF